MAPISKKTVAVNPAILKRKRELVVSNIRRLDVEYGDNEGNPGEQRRIFDRLIVLFREDQTLEDALLGLDGKKE